MIDLIIKLLAFIVAISVLVAIHEFGHYWVARKLGFKVERFSIGFGRALFTWSGKDADQVEYRIAAIPLGGYVKMLDERDAAPNAPDLERAFNRRPIPHRIAVLAAGPAFNFIFSIAAFAMLYMLGVSGLRPLVFQVTPDSPAAMAGLAADDVIERVGDNAVATWDGAAVSILDEILTDGMIELGVRDRSDRSRNLTIDVRGLEHELTEPDALFRTIGVGPLPTLPPIAGEVSLGGPADVAGIRSGDIFLAIDGQAVTDFNMLAELVRARPGETAVFELERESNIIQLTVAIDRIVEDGTTLGRINVGPIREWPAEIRERLDTLEAQQRYGVIESLERGVKRTWGLSVMMVRMIGRMIVGDVSLRSMSGPVTIADYAGDYAQAGFKLFIEFLAKVSISLGVFNLFPIPLLDGGQIVFQLVEWVKGSPLSERAMAMGQQIGVLFFILIFSLVFYNDLTRVFS